MILIIGCGYVGERVADILHAKGHEVMGVTHSAESAARLSELKPYGVLPCDVSDASSVQHLAAQLATPPQSIIHCASSNRGGAEMYRRVYLEGCAHLQRVFPSARLLFTSSSSVYPQTDGSIVTEESDASPDRETGLVLRQTEELVLTSGCVARLAGIYGPGRSFVLKNFLEGAAAIEGNGGEGRYLNQIHREDAASALVHLVTHVLDYDRMQDARNIAKDLVGVIVKHGAVNKPDDFLAAVRGGLGAEDPREGIFNVSDDSPMTQRECFTHLCERFHKPMPPISEPNTDRKRAWTHKRLSNARLRGTGWAPHYSSYLDALGRDPELIPSILAQVRDA